MGTMKLKVFTLKEDKALLIRCADDNANHAYQNGSYADNALKVFIYAVRKHLQDRYQGQPYTFFKAENGSLEIVVILNENDMGNGEEIPMNLDEIYSSPINS